MRGNAVKRGEIENFRLPCAGITLIRFYGYNLSRALFAEKLILFSFKAKHPGNLAINILFRIA